MPHVVYLHSALVQPRLKQLSPTPAVYEPAPPVKGVILSEESRALAASAVEGPAVALAPPIPPHRNILSNFLRFELIDVFVAMNGAWLINSAMILMAAVAFLHSSTFLSPTADPIREAYRTLGPLFGPAAAIVFAVALLCSGLASSTVGVMAGQVIIEGFLNVKFPIYLRRLITIVPAIAVIAIGLEPFKILVLSQVVLSFALPFALIPLLILTSRPTVMDTFASSPRTRLAGWLVTLIILTLNAILMTQLALA